MWTNVLLIEEKGHETRTEYVHGWATDGCVCLSIP